MNRVYTVVAVPDECEDEVPFSYEESGFVHWVDEVFLEGYKLPEDAPFPSPEECLSLLKAQGYTVEVHDE